jgi:hypothetical protein
MTVSSDQLPGTAVCRPRAHHDRRPHCRNLIKADLELIVLMARSWRVRVHPWTSIVVHRLADLP